MPVRPRLVPWPRAAGAVVLVATALFVALGFVVHGQDHGLAVDDAFRRWTLQTFDVYTRFDMVQLTDPGAIVIATVLIAGFAALARRWDLAGLAIAAPLVGTGLTEYVFKPLFGRTVRAVQALTGQVAPAYPSGHETAVSTVLALLGLLILRSPLPITARVAGLLGLGAYYVVTVFGLVGQSYHYVTDTIGALALAIALVLGGALALDWLARRRVS